MDRDGRVSLLTPWWREAFVAEESWAHRVDCFDWCKRGCQVDPDQAVIEWLGNERARQGIERIGAHLQVHHYGPNKMPSECLTYARIRAALPSVFTVIEDAGDRINQLKAVKTSREIGKLKLAHQVVRAGAQAFYRLAEAGIREIDLATEVHCAVLRKAASMGIAYVFCEMPQITSGPERTLIADTLSNHPTARKLQQGDPVLLELGAHAEGYWADITRAAVVGEPPPLLRRLHQAVLDAQAAAIASYVPEESTGEQLCQASWRAMREAGFESGNHSFSGTRPGFRLPRGPSHPGSGGAPAAVAGAGDLHRARALLAGRQPAGERNPGGGKRGLGFPGRGSGDPVRLLPGPGPGGRGVLKTLLAACCGSA